MEYEITKSQIRQLKKIVRKIVIQSHFHKINIIEYYRIMIDAARSELSEDNIPTFNSFLRECFEEALNLSYNQGEVKQKGDIMVNHDIEKFRGKIEERYERYPTRCGGSFGEILCFEFHTQPVNPRMQNLTFSGGYATGLTFKELAQKWGITVTFLGELIADHCKKLEE